MKRLLLMLVLLVCFVGMSTEARHLVTTTENTTYWNYIDTPDTEVYILDEEANKDKLYCKTKTDSEGNVIQTDWYNYCTLEFVRSEEGDKCTKELRYPEFECEFAKGSNADKLYCRTMKDNEGGVVETRWFNYCSNEIVKTEEKDTCTDEFKDPQYKCYKEETVEEVPEEIPEEKPVETPAEEPVEVPPEEAPEIAPEPEITPVESKPYNWIAVVAVLVIIVVAGIMFWKIKRKKGPKEEEVKEEKTEKKAKKKK